MRDSRCFKDPPPGAVVPKKIRLGKHAANCQFKVMLITLCRRSVRHFMQANETPIYPVLSSSARNKSYYSVACMLAMKTGFAAEKLGGAQILFSTCMDRIST